MQRGQEGWAIVNCILTPNIGKPRIPDVVYARNGIVHDHEPIGHHHAVQQLLVEVMWSLQILSNRTGVCI